eukprot:7355332-Pyramimonas_sp.AAC.1
MINEALELGATLTQKRGGGRGGAPPPSTIFSATLAGHISEGEEDQEEGANPQLGDLRDRVGGAVPDTDRRALNFWTAARSEPGYSDE